MYISTFRLLLPYIAAHGIIDPFMHALTNFAVQLYVVLLGRNEALCGNAGYLQPFNADAWTCHIPTQR